MNPSDVDWNEFENAVYQVVSQCLQYLAENPPSDPIYAVGVEGMVEEGLISVGANTTSARLRDAEWWMPDWNLRHLDESLSTDPVTTIFQPLAKSISEISYAKNPEETYQKLVQSFRLACLKALKRIEKGIENYSFPRSPDFSLMYMDGDDGYYQGGEGLANGIESLT